MNGLGITVTTLWRALFVFCVLCIVLSVASAGCSSGAICYRNTDCPSGAHCKDGQCVIIVIDPDGGSQAADAH